MRCSLKGRGLGFRVPGVRATLNPIMLGLKVPGFQGFAGSGVEGFKAWDLDFPDLGLGFRVRVCEVSGIWGIECRT